MDDPEKLIKTVKSHYPDIDEGVLVQAFDFAKKHHGSQTRESGDPYYYHPVEVAQLLADMRMDASTVITALLHDTVEDTDATLEDIEKIFGAEIRKLVDGVTKLTKIELQSEDTQQAENFRKLLLAISEDIRVLLVKLADRVHNMRTLEHLKNPQKRLRIARETMEIYAPLAERIGVRNIKDELQDLAFKELQPDAYKSITHRLEYLRSKDTEAIGKVTKEITEVLKKAGVKSRVSGREKKPYSIWRKMERKNVSFEQMTDIMAFRVIVAGTEECYAALGIIHASYQMVPDNFKDFISTPKGNGYQSLHTIVVGPDHQRIEIQIRSKEMHEVAELGVAAHWAYKQEIEGTKIGSKYKWVRELVQIVEMASTPEEFLEDTKLEMYHDQVFCFTPKGRLIALPLGATPVDFAFAVHSEVGRTCVGAKINGRIVPLRTQLKNGDQVEIICAKSQHPSPSWEKFVVTGKALSEIRRFIRSQQRDEFIVLGKAILAKVFSEENTEFHEKDVKPALEAFGKKTLDDLYAAVGEGLISKVEVFKAVHPHKTLSHGKKRLSLLERLRGRRTQEKEKISIPIKGLVPGMAIHFAGCCHPLPGESIVGIVNSGKGVTVHTADCKDLESYIDEPERWIDVEWEKEHDDKVYVGRLKATLAHEAGSLGILANSIAKDEANINNIRITNRADDFFELIVDVEVKDVKHLAKVMSSLRSKKAIYSVERHVSGR